MAKFKTRARTVDMLGRQQIAGIPTAISELFKNAHDAYADHVQVDYFKSDRLFVLRDDGLGMTLDDFENRWLTIGTESKVKSSKGISKPSVDANKGPRPIMGEKGIGRLAIGVIGSQLLVLTRANLDGVLGDLVGAFIHWGLFEAPGVNIDQIDIPVRIFKGGTLPTNDEVLAMVDSVRQNTVTLLKEEYLETELGQQILDDLAKFNLDIEGMVDVLGVPTLLGNGHGTHFYILPAKEELQTDLDEDMDIKATQYSQLRKQLLGFSNTMSPRAPEPLIRTSFKYREYDDGQPVEMIAGREFFTREDFSEADHKIHGRFDEYGQFVGTIEVYGKKYESQVINWNRNLGQRLTACGAFELHLGYSPGEKKRSALQETEYARLQKKLELIGGFYVYKDNIRVLPYGGTDEDFLKFEERRSKRAGNYFFSYRRMMASVSLTQKNNEGLKEKAGREGFQENKAFREFRDILINFFIEVARDYFTEKGEKAEAYKQNRQEQKRREEAKKQQEEQSKQKRESLRQKIDSFFEESKEEIVQASLDAILNELKSEIDSAVGQVDAEQLVRAERNAHSKLRDLRQQYTIELPADIGLDGQLKRDWKAYHLEQSRLEQDVFEVAQNNISLMTSEISSELNQKVDRKKQLKQFVDDIISESKSDIEENLGAMKTALEKLNERATALEKQIREGMKQNIAQVEMDINAIEFDSRVYENIDAIRRQNEESLSNKAREYRQTLKYVIEQIDSVQWYKNEDGFLISGAELKGALEEEIIALRERAEADLELTQLGMSIDIINHEFSNTIRAIRTGLNRLKSWANSNASLMPVYRQIADSFSHLDGYLSLFTPLHRRLYRSAIEIKGANIAEYIHDVFRDRLAQREIELIVTEAFSEMTIKGFPSTFYPVFVNLVDNATFWLENSVHPRQVTLDARSNAFIVSDNGPGIPARDQEVIFELGFTRKPGGRGMGLYISKEVLKREGFELQLDVTYSKKGTTFIIQPTHTTQ